MTKNVSCRRWNKNQLLYQVINSLSTNLLESTNVPSFLWPMHQNLYNGLSEHLDVGTGIIDYNYVRLSKCINLWAKERTVRFDKKPEEVILDLSEYPVALEFFLQTDGKSNGLIFF